MKPRYNLWIILSCIVLIVGAFGYGYYTTLKKMANEAPIQKPGTRINIKNEIPPANIEDEDVDEGVSRFPEEDRVVPSTIVLERIESINTGTSIEKQIDIPEEIINFTKDQVIDYFSEYNSVEFSTEKIVLTNKYPYLPNCFVVILEDNFINVYSTDDHGKATRDTNFEPIPCKGRNQVLKEVDNLGDVQKLIGDYIS